MVAPEPPPTWDEIASDPEFQKKPADRRLIIFDRWTNDVLPHITKQPDWHDQQTTFLSKTEDMRKKLSQEAGGLTPDQARVKLAHETLRQAKPDGGLTEDEERMHLKPLGMDIAKAFYDDRAGVNKGPAIRDITKGDLPMVEGISNLTGGAIPSPSAINKVLVPLGAGMANAPGQAMNMLEYVDHFLQKIPDAITGSRHSAEATERMAKTASAANERRDIAKEASGETVGSIGTVVGEQLPMLPLQLATGGLGSLAQGVRGAITASAMFGGLQSASDSFSGNVAERIQNGESPENAADAELLPSIASGVITGAVTKLFGATGIERIFKAGGGKAVMSKLSEAIRGAGGEMAEEVTDEAGQIINDLTFGRDVNKQEIIQRVGTAAVVAGMLGGGINGLHSALAKSAPVNPEATKLAEELKKTGSPKTAETIAAEARAPVVAAASADPEVRPGVFRTTDKANVPPDATSVTELKVAGEPTVYEYRPKIQPEAAAPAAQPEGIRLSSKQGPDGEYQHEFSIPDSATTEELQQFLQKLDLSHLPPEAATALTNQIDAEIARKTAAAAAPPAGPATTEPPVAPAEPAATAAQPQEAGKPGPYIVSTAIRDSAAPDKVVRGTDWNSGHDTFTREALEAGIEPDTLERGFIVREQDGTEHFVSRERASIIASLSGQAASDPTRVALRSQDLIEQAKAASLAEPRAVIAPEGESLAPAPAARPLAEPAPPPTAAQIARANPRTPEEKAAALEQGSTQLREQVTDTGVVPTTNEIRKMIGGDAAAGAALRKEMLAYVAQEYPLATAPEGTKVTTDQHPVTREELPSTIDASGKVTPMFTNDPQITAQQIDMGVASHTPGSRLYLPEGMQASQVNPSIQIAKEKVTGRYYVIGADASLPDGKTIRVTQPDQYTPAYQESRRLVGDAQKPLGLKPETLQQVATAVEKGLSDRGLDFGPLEFDLEEATDPGEAPPAEDASKIAVQAQTSELPITGDGLTQTILGNVDALAKVGLGKKGNTSTNPLKDALQQIVKSKSIPENSRILAKQLLKSPFDWSKVKLTYFTRPNEDASGYYTALAGAENGHIELNLGATHIGSAVTTLLHEAVHHTTLLKLADNYARSPIEQKAYDQIKAAYDKVLAEVYETETGKKGTPEELAKFARRQAGDKRIKNYRQNSIYYGLGNLKEFVAESLSSARFQRLLSSFDAPQAAGVKGKIGNVLNAMRNALKNLFTNQEIKRGSLLDQALEGGFQLLKEKTRAESIGTGKGTSAEAKRIADNTAKMSRRELEEAYTSLYGSDGPDLEMFSSEELRNALQPDSLDRAEEARKKSGGSSEIGEDPYGWLGPDGKFYDVVMNHMHEDVARTIIESDPKLQAAFQKALAKNPNLELIEGVGNSQHDMTKFMADQGFARITSNGNTIYVEGKPSTSQKRTLRDAGIEQKVHVIHDLGGGREVPIYQHGPRFAQAAAPKPTLVHNIGPDGKVAHEADIPDTATPEQLKDFIDEIAKSRLPDADKARLTQQVTSQVTTAAQNAALATNVAPPATPTSSGDGGLFDMISKTARKYLTAEGNLPKDVFHKWQEREGAVKAKTREAAYTLRQLYAGVQKEFGISSGERLVKGLGGVPVDFVQKMNDALLGKVPMSQLPETVRGPLQEMRAQIDSISQEFIDAGLADGDLAAKFADNFGTYMTRSYRVFDDPNWPKSIPADVRNKARAFFLSELRADNPAATEADADRMMASLLQDWKEQGDTRGVAPGRGPKLGSMNQSVLMKRGDIPPEVRAFMGEHEDPAINFMRSVTKMTNTLGNARFLKQVREQGMGNFLFEDGKEPQGFSSQIAAEGSEMMAPLNGLRTTPEIAEAFREFGKAADPGGAAFRFWMKLASAAKGAKTVGSLMTQIRNAQQFWFFAMNGHYDMTKAREAFMATGADLGLNDNAKWRSFYTKMTKLGVVNQSTHAGELRDTINEALLPTEASSEFNSKGKTAMNAIRNIAKKPFDVAARAYQISDDMGKIVGFLNEQKRQAAQHPDWTPEQVDTEAAQRLRLTYPSYSMVPEAVKQTRRQPLFGPFMTFGYETLRTTYHNLRLTADAIKNARTATDPEVKKAYQAEAAQRMAGQMAVLGGAGLAASLVTRMLTGLRKEEEDDARKFLPEWDKNAQLLFTGKENGKLDYVNISYSNPYSIFPDSVGAVVRGAMDDKSIVGSIGDAAKEFLKPYVSENILASALIDVRRNKRATNGRPVYNEGDTQAQQIKDILGRFYESLEPGSLTRLRTKIIPAARGETRHGQELSVARELGSEFTGFKTQKMDFRDALGFKGSDFARTLRETDSILRNTILREGNVTPEEILSTYARSEGQRYAMFKELHDIALASIRRGVPPSEVRTILRKRGNVAKEIVSAVMADRYHPQDISKDTRKRLREMKRVLPPLTSPYKHRSLSDGQVTKPPTLVEP